MVRGDIKDCFLVIPNHRLVPQHQQNKTKQKNRKKNLAALVSTRSMRGCETCEVRYLLEDVGHNPSLDPLLLCY